MSTLPPALSPWAPQLSALTDELSVALGPWLTEIAALLAEHDNALSEHGEPDGFDGLTVRGTPHRMLVSEWLLATEEPVEFLRRAAENELLHLAPAFRQSAPHARIAVLCDCGPAQWGPARLAQLAVLLVMHRRAVTHGVPLTVGVLGDQPGKWCQGEELEPMLKGWQRSRSTSSPGAQAVDGWVGTLEAGDEIWLLGGDYGREWTNVRHLAIAESGWDGTGVVALTVSLGGRDRVLAMPPPEQAIAALRGDGFRSGRKQVTAKPGLLRFPMFPNASRTLVGRGDDERTVLTVTVPDGRPRRHTFPAPVVAAGLYGRRLVVLTLAEGILRPHIDGKPLAFLAGARWPHPGEVRTDAPLAPLYMAPNGLLTELGDGWIRLHPKHSEPVDAEIVAASFGQDHGRARVASPTGYPDVRVAPGQQVVLGQIPHHCTTSDGRVWTLSGGETFTLPEGDRIVGMTWISSAPAVVSRSGGGQILRLVTPGRTQTLTRWSNRFTVAAATHATHPWLAVAHLDGNVIVADLESGKQIFMLRRP